LIFLELVLENFGPYLGRQVINLRPEKDGNPRPIILFGGMNGGGKTTLMDAIRLALYGQRAQCSTRGNLSYSEFLTQSVNKHTPPVENTRIELVVEHIVEDQLTELRIVRYWYPNPKDGKDTLGILDGEWPVTHLVNTWDEYIENVLPLGISNLFLFDGEQVKELAEQDTPPPEVVEAIQSLLGLELAERLSEDLDVIVRRKRKALANTKDLANLDEIEKKLSSQQEQYEEAKKEIKTLQNGLDQARKKLRESSDKFRSEGGKIAAERKHLEKQKGDFEADAARSRQELVELASGSLPLVLIEHLLSQAQAQAEKERKREQASMARDILTERDERLLERIGGLGLTPAQFEKIKWFIDEQNLELDREIGWDEESWLAADEETKDALANLLRYELPHRVKMAQEKQVYLEKKEEEIVSIEKQLAGAASPEVYEQLQEAVNRAQADLASSQGSYDAGKQRCKELEAAIAKTKKDLEAYSEKSIERLNDEHIIAASAKVQDTLKLFRERLTRRKLNKLEVEVTECFRYLLHKSDLVHRIAIDIKTFSLSLYDPQGQPVPKHRLSAGEKQLLAIAFLWSLARVSGRNLPVAIDTPLGRLDSSHRQNLVERYFPAASHQVILLSTDTEIGETEVKRLRQQEAIAREYLLKYDSAERQTIVETGYFW
jgi:DNA sulfur modification protein DndD